MSSSSTLILKTRLSSQCVPYTSCSREPWHTLSLALWPSSVVTNHPVCVLWYWAPLCCLQMKKVIASIQCALWIISVAVSSLTSMPASNEPYMYWYSECLQVWVGVFLWTWSCVHLSLLVWTFLYMWVWGRNSGPLCERGAFVNVMGQTKWGLEDVCSSVGTHISFPPSVWKGES